MKSKLGWIAALFLISSTSFSDTKVHTQKDVLDAMDKICGDTWCEGDFGYSFKKVVCESTGCSVFFQMSLDPSFNKMVEKKNNDYIAQVKSVSGRYKYNVTCVLPKMKSYNDMMAEVDGDTSPAYYNTFTDCIGDLEKMIYGLK